MVQVIKTRHSFRSLLLLKAHLLFKVKLLSFLCYYHFTTKLRLFVMQKKLFIVFLLANVLLTSSANSDSPFLANEKKIYNTLSEDTKEALLPYLLEERKLADIDTSNHDIVQDTSFTKSFLASIIKKEPWRAEIAFIQRVNKHKYKSTQRFIEAGIHVNAIHFDTALTTAISKDDKNMVELLINAGVDVNLKNSLGNSPISLAMKLGNSQIIKMLLKHGATLPKPLSNMLSAILSGDKAQVEHLIAQDDDCYGEIEVNRPALIWAADIGNFELVELFLNYPNHRNDVMYWDSSDARGKTVLMFAADKGHAKIVELLLKKGARVNTQGPKRLTALMMASKNGHKGCVALLLAHGANIHDKDMFGRSALMRAISHDQKEIVELLLRAGADNVISPFHSPLCNAAKKGNATLIEMLLNHGADINRPAGQNTPLNQAIRAGSKEAVALLLSKGAVLDNAFSGLSVLELAILEGHKEIVELLLQHEADVHTIISRNVKTTPLILAAQSGRKDIMNLLLAHGANALQKDSYGHTAAEYYSQIEESRKNGDHDYHLKAIYLRSL